MTDVIDWHLTDFLPEYPSIDTENLQTLISAKKEFIETASSINEPKPQLGELYKHQQFVLRYLRNYNEVLLADQPGTGKTCSELSITEYAKEEFLKSLKYDTPYDIKNAHYKKTIVLVKGKSLTQEVKKQLVCKCTKDKYDFSKLITNKDLEKVSPRKLIKKEIEKWYVFYTYETFAKHLYKKYGDDYEAMRVDYNHSIVIVDEAHNLFIEEETDTKIKSDNKWNKDRTYQILDWFFHHLQYSKKILATATPMLNIMSEFGKLMNLILPEDLQMPVRKDFDSNEALEKVYQKMSLEELNRYIRGRVLFVRAFDTGATRIDMVNNKYKCPKCPDLNPIYMTEMSDFQTKIYKNVLETKGSSAYSLYLNYASNFVFPDGSFSDPEEDKNTEESDELKGKNGKDAKNIKKDAKKKVLGMDTETEQSESEESEESVKEKKKKKKKRNKSESEESEESEEIVKKKKRKNKSESEETEESEENETEESEESSKGKKKNKKPKKSRNAPKVGFNKYVIEESIGKKRKQTIYKLNRQAKPELVLDSINDVRKYSCKYAAIIEALEKPGSSFIYGRYNTGSGNIMLGICMEEAAGYERLMETESVFETKEQKAGYCDNGTVERTLKPGFAKKKRYALLTADVLENDAAFNAMMELMNSYENRHGEYLKCIIASRVARDGLNFSNIVKIIITGPDWNSKSTYQAISRGIRAGSHIDLINELGKVDIDVYQMAAVPKQKILKNLGVDIHIYEIAYNKDINTSHFMRKVIQCTVGCQIQYQRNVRDTDIDYSAACYYEKCDYYCVDSKPKAIDYTTYNAYYIEEDVIKLVDLLKNNLLTWSQGKIFKIEDVYAKIPQNYTMTCLRLALEKMIKNKIQLIDLYGFVSYLYQEHNQYYLSRDYQSKSITSFIYTNQLNVTRNMMNEFFEELNVQNYENFLSMESEEDILLYFGLLSTDNKIKFLETQYINPDPKYDFITTKYKRLFFKMNQLKLNEKPMKSNLSPKAKGRPKKAEIAVGKTISLDNIVYVNMLQLYKGTNKHNFIPFYFKANTPLRIYNPEEKSGWRDMTASEQEMYSGKLVELNNKKFNKMQLKHNNLFGINIGGEMVIVYEEENAKKKNADKGINRSEARGRECESYSKETLEDIALKLNISKSKLYQQEKLKTIDQLCTLIKNELIQQDKIF